MGRPGGLVGDEYFVFAIILRQSLRLVSPNFYYFSAADAIVGTKIMPGRFLDWRPPKCLQSGHPALPHTISQFRYQPKAIKKIRIRDRNHFPFPQNKITYTFYLTTVSVAFATPSQQKLQPSKLSPYPAHNSQGSLLCRVMAACVFKMSLAQSNWAFF